MNSTSMSINLPVTSGIAEKNCAQETFAGPSFVIAAMQLSASMRRDLSLALPESKEIPLPHLEGKKNTALISFLLGSL